MKKHLMTSAWIMTALLAGAATLHAQEETYELDIQTAVPSSSLYFQLTEDLGERVKGRPAAGSR